MRVGGAHIEFGPGTYEISYRGDVISSGLMTYYLLRCGKYVNPKHPGEYPDCGICRVDSLVVIQSGDDFIYIYGGVWRGHDTVVSIDGMDIIGTGVIHSLSLHSSIFGAQSHNNPERLFALDDELTVNSYKLRYLNYAAANMPYTRRYIFIVIHGDVRHRVPRSQYTQFIKNILYQYGWEPHERACPI